MSVLARVDRIWIVLAASTAVSLALYAASFDNGFRHDDFAYLEHVISGTPPECFFLPSDSFAFYRPGAICLFFLEHRIFGFTGGRYILFNYLAHVAIGALFVGLLLLLEFDKRVAVLAGSLFLVGAGHYGKTVMWASCGGALFAWLFSLAAMTLSARWARSIGAPASIAFPGKWGLAICAFALLFASPFFHESALAAAPLSICIVVLFGRRGWKSKSICAALLIFVALLPAGVFLSLRSRYQSYGVSADIIPHAARAIVHHLGFMAMPLQSSPIAERGPAAVGFLARHMAPVHFAAGAAIALGAAAWMLSPLPGRRIVGIWLMLALAPFMLVSMPEGYHELRYVYAASLPFSVLAASLVLSALRSRKRTARIAGWAILAYLFLAAAALTTILERTYDAAGREPANVERLEEIRSLNPF